MALIVRCPSCGAVWRLTQNTSSNLLCECSACHTKFPLRKADTLTIDDERLRSVLPQKETLIVPTATDTEPQKKERNATTATAGSPIKAILFILCLLCGVVAAGLYANQWVLQQAPWLQPVYEKVCGTLPCPNFVWQDAKAIQSRIRLLNTRFPYQMELTIRNTSDRKQGYPVLEISFLNVADEVIAQRLTEPQEYGVPKGSILEPQSTQTYYLVLPPSQKPFRATHVRAIPLQKL